LRRTIQHRHAVRVHPGVGGRHRPAEEATRQAARVPRAVRAAVPADLDRLLPGADDGPAAADVAAVLRMARDRAGDLLVLQPVPQHAAGGRYFDGQLNTVLYN